MKVRIVAVTQPLPEAFSYGAIDSPGALMAYCARVSNPSNQHNTATAARLLRYMVRKQHWSPFEMVHAVLEITAAPRDITRQVLRHRSFSFQEFSQRYAAVLPNWIYREARLQDENDRQNSIPLTNENRTLPNGVDIGLAWEDAQRRVAYVVEEAYKEALEMGIAKEVARAVLPEGMTPTSLYMAGSMRSWLHYTGLRGVKESGTQLEHRDVANACRAEFLRVVPELEEVV